MLRTPYSRAVCANCKNVYNAEDKYCRFCGAPMGSPRFISEGFPVVYGPRPIKRTHTCKKCGFTWETFQMVDKTAWCPKCGGSAPAVEKEDDFFSPFKKKIPSNEEEDDFFSSFDTNIPSDGVCKKPKRKSKK